MKFPGNFNKFNTIEVLEMSKTHFFQHKTLQKFHPLKFDKNGGVQYHNPEPKSTILKQYGTFTWSGYCIAQSEYKNAAWSGYIFN